MEFALDPRLSADSFLIGDLRLSRALLMNDARYPWVILTPRRAGAVEIADLSPADRAWLIEEIVRASKIVRALPGVEKINVGALGNIVSQLHVHVVGRSSSDMAWPGPVWGIGTPRRYDVLERDALLAIFRKELGLKVAPENA